MLAASDINSRFDLLRLAESDTALKKSGSWYIGPCPFCGGRDRFTLKPTPAGWRWYCRSCGGEKYNSSIDYVARRENLDFLGALKWAGNFTGASDHPQRQPAKERPPESPIPPGEWQAAAGEFLAKCENNLWAPGGARALDYLRGRGLKDTTIRKFRLGFNPADAFDYKKSWGLDDKDDGKRHLWLPRGITIPSYGGDILYSINVRRALGEPKYAKVSGGASSIFNVGELRGAWLAVFCEGEFDAMLLDQEAGDLCAAVTLGSASYRLGQLDLSHWAAWLLPVTHFLAALDNDSQGQKGLEHLASFSARVRACPLPGEYKDVTDFYLGGGDLGDWITAAVDALGLLKCELGQEWPVDAKQITVNWPADKPIPACTEAEDWPRNDAQELTLPANGGLGWRRLSDGKVQATYTRDSLDLALWAYRGLSEEEK